MRARHIHALEALVDNIVGYVISVGVAVIVFNHWLGYDITLGDNMTAGAAFFVVAFIRKYTIRRLSSNIIERMYAKRKKT